MRSFLMPREHGAYAQLTFPLLSGLLLGGATLPGLGLALTGLAFFLAWEPVVVLLGVRGVRLQREQAQAARRQLTLLLPLGLAAAAASLWATSPAARLLALVPAAACGLLLPLVPARRVKTLAGETLVAAALAAMHLPIAAAGQATGARLWGPALVWFAGFFLATLAVHAIKARLKRPDALIGEVTRWSAFGGVMAASALAIFLPPLRLLGIALALPLFAVFVLNAARVHPRALKRVGWTLVATDTATLLLLTLL